MLEHMTGGRFHSAHHLVVPPDGVGTKERFSSALFVHARSDFMFEGHDNEDRYPYMTAGELLLKRLEEIGLAKKVARGELGLES